MKEKPNVIYIYADDLGRGMLSCYGQTIFSTPNIDKLALQGMSMMNIYGCSICAPARASMLCGIHDVHAGRWTFNRAGIYKDIMRGKLTLDQVYELINNTGIEQRAQDVYLPMVMKKAGYATGQIGKLEWGFSTTGDEIAAHGWDYHYGYYDHEMCHGYYPPFLFENGEMIPIEGNTHIDCGKGPNPRDPDFEDRFFDREGREVFCQDLFDEKIIAYLRAHKDEPFFLYHPSMLPHGVLSITELDPRVKDNDKLNFHEKVYASMVLRLDKTVGLILDELDRLGLTDNTIVLFSSDNGHTPYYSHKRMEELTQEQRDFVKSVDNIHTRLDSRIMCDVFNGNDSMAGFKASNWEGGTRIPYIVRWPGKIAEGVRSTQLIANYDLMATLADLAGVEIGSDKDGVSFLPCLLGQEMDGHDYVVYGSSMGPALVTKDGFKLRTRIDWDKYRYGLFGAFWREMKENPVVFQLYNIKEDYSEEHEVSAEYPEVFEKLISLLLKECDGNVGNGTPQWHFAFYSDPIQK
jgi:arylsulfatase A-like enzyme